MTNYLLAVYDVGGEEPPADAVISRMHADVEAFNERLRASGAWVFLGALHTPDTATVVQAHEGDTVVTDGPLPAANEQIGGFWIVNVPDLDAALALAAEASAACRGPVEVRPFQDADEVLDRTGVRL